MVVQLTLYTRPGCHLCEEMKAQLKQAQSTCRFELEEVDIGQNLQLQNLYGLSIPVLAINGRNAFKGRMTLEQFFEKFERLKNAEKSCPG